MIDFTHNTSSTDITEYIVVSTKHVFNTKCVFFPSIRMIQLRAY